MRQAILKIEGDPEILLQNLINTKIEIISISFSRSLSGDISYILIEDNGWLDTWFRDFTSLYEKYYPNKIRLIKK